MRSTHQENPQLTAMVAWFKDNYSALAPLLVYAPRATSKAMEKKGSNYGGAELILLYPANGYSSLCVQVLSSTERNSDCHKFWRATVEHAGNKCYTIRDFLNFTYAVEEYLENTPYA